MCSRQTTGASAKSAHKFASVTLAVPSLAETDGNMLGVSPPVCRGVRIR
jgi:hypothetical protein